MLQTSHNTAHIAHFRLFIIHYKLYSTNCTLYTQTVTCDWQQSVTSLDSVKPSQSKIIVSMAVVTLVGAHDYLPCYGCPHNATNHICGNYEAAWSEIMVDRYLVKGRGEGSLNVDINAFSNHRPFGMMLSISQFSHMSVCVSVCSLLRYRLNVFLPPTSQNRMSKVFRG